MRCRGAGRVHKGPHLLQAPWGLPQREGRDVRAVFIGQLHNYCLPMRRGHSWWWVVGDGGGCGGGVGEAKLYAMWGHAVRCRIVQNWNRLGTYTANAFSLHTLSQIVQQMANKLLHVLFPYKVSKITQHRKKTTPILSFK